MMTGEENIFAAVLHNFGNRSSENFVEIATETVEHKTFVGSA